MIKLFYLPAIPGIDRNSMPGSVEECKLGLEAAERQEREEANGTLTQMGGDCLVRSFARRFRFVRLPLTLRVAQSFRRGEDE